MPLSRSLFCESLSACLLLIRNVLFRLRIDMLYNRIAVLRSERSLSRQAADDWVPGAGGLYALAGAGFQDQPVLQAAGGGGVFAGAVSASE